MALFLRDRGFSGGEGFTGGGHVSEGGGLSCRRVLFFREQGSFTGRRGFFMKKGYFLENRGFFRVQGEGWGLCLQTLLDIGSKEGSKILKITDVINELPQFQERKLKLYNLLYMPEKCQRVFFSQTHIIDQKPQLLQVVLRCFESFLQGTSCD